MGMTRRRGVVLGTVGLLLVLGGLWGVRTPVGAALTKSTKSFTPVPGDARVRFEPGAEAMAAAIGAYLDTALTTVETAHGKPFRKPITVYVCATQRSLNEFLALAPDAPIRGMVRAGNVFLAPSAFAWRGEDVHRQSLTHELSHAHLRQHLGWIASRRAVPAWFHEALADLVSGAGGEGVSREEAVRAILDGPALRPDSAGRLWSLRRAGAYGLTGPMLHRQARMFIEYLRDRNPAGFRPFVTAIQDERTFAGPFRRHFGGSVNELWERFVDSLRAERGAGGPGRPGGDSRQGRRGDLVVRFSGSRADRSRAG